MRTAAVYAIEILRTGMMYVGCSIRVEERWRHHLNWMKRGVHGVPQMQTEFDRYGASSFKFSILEKLPENPTPIERRVRELYWMQKFSDQGKLANEYQTSCPPDGHGFVGCDPRDPDMREGARRRMQARFEDQNYKKRVIKELDRARVMRRDPKETMSAQWADRKSDITLGRIKGLHAAQDKVRTPEERAKRAARIRELNLSPEFQAKRKEALHKRYAALGWKKTPRTSG